MYTMNTGEYDHGIVRGFFDTYEELLEVAMYGTTFKETVAANSVYECWAERWTSNIPAGWKEAFVEWKSEERWQAMQLVDYPCQCGRMHGRFPIDNAKFHWVTVCEFEQIAWKSA
jgi:hypothetical protein